MDIKLKCTFNNRNLWKAEIMSRIFFQQYTLSEGDIFFSEKDCFGVRKQCFQKKDVCGYSALLKNWMYAKIRLVRKTVFQYGLRIMLNNRKF